MFDIFHKKKIKELETDIKMLYKLYGNLERRAKGNEVFESFVSNPDIINRYMCSLDIPSLPETQYEDISVKTILGMVLKKMGLKIGYTPAVIPHETPSEFKLVKKE